MIQFDIDDQMFYYKTNAFNRTLLYICFSRTLITTINQYIQGYVVK